jgi:hypothetical protein
MISQFLAARVLSTQERSAVLFAAAVTFAASWRIEFAATASISAASRGGGDDDDAVGVAQNDIAGSMWMRRSYGNVISPGPSL